MRLAILTTLFASACANPSGSDAEPPACPLSPIAEATYLAAAGAPASDSLIPAEAILSFANTAGPALLDGGEIFPELAALVAGAERSVDIAMFVWEVDSDASRALMSALASLDERGPVTGEPVRVRLLVNDITLTGGGVETLEAMRAEIDVLDLDRTAVDVEVAIRSHTAFGAMHEKLAIIDRRVAHLGGANVEAIHDWTAEDPPWRDSAYVVRGEVAGSLAHAFDALWGSPPTAAAEPTPAADCVPMIALNRKPIGSMNNSTDSALARGYLAAWAASERSIDLQTPNLNDDAAIGAVLDAVGRGVDVRILLPRGFNEAAANVPGQGGGNAENVDRLYAEATIAFGAEHACRHLDIRWYARDGQVIDGNGPGAAHLKYVRFDAQLTAVGSANMDTQSWNNSGETVVAVYDAATAGRWNAKIFDPSFANAEPTGHCD